MGKNSRSRGDALPRDPATHVHEAKVSRNQEMAWPAIILFDNALLDGRRRIARERVPAALRRLLELQCAQ
jgi:hypothetical protein